MQKNRAERNTIAEFAVKHSVKEAAEAYHLSNAAVYRCLKIYRQADDYPPMSISLPQEAMQNTGSEATISVTFLKEYFDADGILRQVYQLSAIHKFSKAQYKAFSLENNKTIVDIFKEYLTSCYQQAGKELKTVHCAYYKSSTAGYSVPDSDLRSRKKTAGLLTDFLDQNPEINDCNQLLPCALADQILTLPENGETVPVIYPIIVQLTLLREIVRFEEQSQVWHKLLNSDKRSDLLEKAVKLLENLAVASYKKGNSGYSVEIYRRILQHTECQLVLPQLASRILIHKARILNQKKECKQALQDLELAIELDPDNCEAHLILGVIYQEMRRYSESENSLNKARDLFKAAGDIRSLACYYECKAIIYYNDREYAKALRNFNIMKDYAVTAEDAVSKFEAECFIGNISFFNRNYNRALQFYHQNEADADLMADNNFKAITCYNLAITYNQLQNRNLAADYLKKGLILAQQYDHWQLIIDIHLEMGDLLLKEEEWQAALKHYNSAWKLHQKFKIADRTTVDILNYQGFISRKLKSYVKAIVYFNRALKIAESAGETERIPYLLGQKADIYRLSGRYAEALRFYKKILVTTENNSTYLIVNAYVSSYIAEAYLHINLIDKARPFLIDAKKQLTNLFMQNPLPKFQRRLDQIRHLEVNF